MMSPNPNFGPCSNPFCEWYGHRCVYNMCGACCRIKHPLLCKGTHPLHPERSGYRNLTKVRIKDIVAEKKPEEPVVPILGILTEITGEFSE